MREVKKFYSEDKLNRGYSKSSDLKFYKDSDIKKKYANNLPPIDVVEAYENLYPGALKKIIQIAENEQNQRNALEKSSIENFEKARKIGTFFGLIISIMICFVTLRLSESSLNHSILFAAIAFGSIALISFIQYKYSIKNQEYRVYNRERKNSKTRVRR